MGKPSIVRPWNNVQSDSTTCWLTFYHPPALPGPESTPKSPWLEQAAPEPCRRPLAPTPDAGKRKDSCDVHSQLSFPFSPILGSPPPLCTMGLPCVPFCPLLQGKTWVLWSYGDSGDSPV